MFKVKKSFSGIISGAQDSIIDIKDKNIIKDLLRAGYIEEYTEKVQTNNELKKEIELLKKQVETLTSENETLQKELEEALKPEVIESNNESETSEQNIEKTDE